MKKEDYVKFLVNYSAVSYGANHKYDSKRKEKLRLDYNSMKVEMLKSLYDRDIKKLTPTAVEFYTKLDENPLFRPETNLKSPIIRPLQLEWNIGKPVDYDSDIDDIPSELTDQENYIQALEIFERKCERRLLDTFNNVDIRGLVKTDPYSLPFTDEIVVRLMGSSYLNSAFEFRRVMRIILHNLLNEGIHDIRFYMFINVITPQTMSITNIFGNIEYRFRYYKKPD